MNSNTGTIIIRKATPSDAQSITNFNIAMALETENKVLDVDTITSGVSALFKHPESGFYVVAEIDAVVVACLMITTEWSDWRNGLFWWIQSVYVAPEHRRKGIYRAMYQSIQDMAKENKDVCGYRLYVEKDNLRAQETYISLGMKETDYKMFEEVIA
jgi:ribosomal protein S18 acetylase RimI-like enzyme